MPRLAHLVGWPCRYESVLDFVFAGGPAQQWRAQSEIVVAPGDFPDDTAKSDHRPVLARFWPAAGSQAAAVPRAVQAVEATANRGANLRSGPGTGDDPHRFDGDGNGIGCEQD